MNRGIIPVMGRTVLAVRPFSMSCRRVGIGCGGRTSVDSGSVLPVSYTHLDVYKRQGKTIILKNLHFEHGDAVRTVRCTAYGTYSTSRLYR